MADPHPPIEVLRAARRWAEEHGHPQPDDRMLAIVYAAGLAAGRTTAAADRAEVLRQAAAAIDPTGNPTGRSRVSALYFEASRANAFLLRKLADLAEGGNRG